MATNTSVAVPGPPSSLKCGSCPSVCLSEHKTPDATVL